MNHRGVSLSAWIIKPPHLSSLADLRMLALPSSCIPIRNRVLGYSLRASAILAIGMALCRGAEDGDYLPIADGLEWIMDLKIVQANGKESEDLAHRKIEGTLERDGKTYFKYKSWNEGDPSASSETLIRKDESGFYFTSEIEATEQPVIVLPLKVGASWKTTMHGATFQNTVLGIEAVVIDN
jgi:hypothetical protein